MRLLNYGHSVLLLMFFLTVSSFSKFSAMVQPFDYDPTEKRLHKFMIQFAFAKDVGDGSLSSFSNVNINYFWNSAMFQATKMK